MTLGGANDRELPLILGLMPVLPQHAVDVATFEETSMTAPIGSGPYRVSAVKPGASVTLTRNPDYWGRDLPINRGLWNFDEIRLDFYREANGQFEAFKRGLYDFRVENEPLRWHDGYDFPAAEDGEVIRDTIKTGMPQPSEFLVFNTRRPVFSDIRVRQALTLLFDFEWINRNYFFGLYTRSGGLFRRLRTVGLWTRRPTRASRSCSSPSRRRSRPTFSTAAIACPSPTDRDATAPRCARRSICSRRPATISTARCCATATTKAPFAFEILVTTRDQERIALAYSRDLKRAGIEATVRAVDAVQFDQRRLGYDFDMIQNRWDQSLSPGNEQSFYWGSEAADIQGTRNYMGAKDPAIDAMIAATARGARPRRLRLGGPRARPRADVGLLRYSRV